MVEQNLTLAVGLAILGGFFQVTSVFVLAYPEHLKDTKGTKISKCLKATLYPVNIFFQLLTGAANTMSAIFGPVSIIMPVTVSAQLLFNIILFGILGMETFSKDVQVGTFTVVLGAFILPIVGPTVQQDQDIMDLISNPFSLIWCAFLAGGIFVSGVLCFTHVNTKRFVSNGPLVYATLIVARVFSSVLSTSLSKALVLVEGVYLVAVICGFLVCGFVLGTSVVLQATKVEQGVFVPAVSCATQLINASTGLILWEDWKVVQSWPGYVATMLQIVVGVYLISSLDFFTNTADPSYALRQSMAIRKVQQAISEVAKDEKLLKVIAAWKEHEAGDKSIASAPVTSYLKSSRLMTGKSVASSPTSVNGSIGNSSYRRRNTSSALTSVSGSIGKGSYRRRNASSRYQSNQTGLIGGSIDRDVHSLRDIAVTKQSLRKSAVNLITAGMLHENHFMDEGDEGDEEDQEDTDSLSDGNDDPSSSTPENKGLVLSIQEFLVAISKAEEASAKGEDTFLTDPDIVTYLERVKDDSSTK